MNRLLAAATLAVVTSVHAPSTLDTTGETAATLAATARQVAATCSGGRTCSCTNIIDQVTLSDGETAISVRPGLVVVDSGQNQVSDSIYCAPGKNGCSVNGGGVSNVDARTSFAAVRRAVGGVCK